MGRVGQIVYVITQKLAGLLVMIDYRVGEWVKKCQNLDYVIFEWSANKNPLFIAQKSKYSGSHDQLCLEMGKI